MREYLNNMQRKQLEEELRELKLMGASADKAAFELEFVETKLWLEGT